MGTFQVSDFGLTTFRELGDLAPPEEDQDDRNFDFLLWRAPELMRQHMPVKGSQVSPLNYRTWINWLIDRSKVFKPWEQVNKSDCVSAFLLVRLHVHRTSSTFISFCVLKVHIVSEVEFVFGPCGSRDRAKDIETLTFNIFCPFLGEWRWIETGQVTDYSLGPGIQMRNINNNIWIRDTSAFRVKFCNFRSLLENHLGNSRLDL